MSGSSIRSTAPAPISPARRIGPSRRRWSKTAGRSSACLFAPVTDEFFMAVAGAGRDAQRRSDRGNDGASLADARIAGPKGFLERLADVAPPFTVMPRVPLAGAASRPRRAGRLDIAIAGGNSHDWDLAAADLLVHEAGGAMTPFGGGPSPIIVPCRGTGCSSRPAGTGMRRSSNCSEIGGSRLPKLHF